IAVGSGRWRWGLLCEGEGARRDDREDCEDWEKHEFPFHQRCLLPERNRVEATTPSFWKECLDFLLARGAITELKSVDQKRCCAESCRRPYFRWKRMEGWRMISKGRIARLVFPVLVATTMEPLLAEEPVGPPPPAKSIREWKSTPIAAPTANAGEP